MRKLLTTLGLMALAATAGTANAQADRHVLSLDDVEITALIDDVSTITGYTFILHPDVGRTRVTVLSRTPMTTNEVFEVFLSTLRVNGFAAIPAGRGVYRIVPEALAVGEAGGAASGPNAFVTQVFTLDSFGAVEAAQMLKPIIDAQGQVVANARSNSVVVVDYASNMPRVREVIQSLDTADRSEVQTVSLSSVPAREMEGILTDLLGTQDGNPRQNFEVTAAQTSNSVIIRGDAPTVARAVQVASELDAAEPTRDNIRVLELNNASAEEIVPVLEKIAATMADQRSPAENAAPPATIAAHVESNSLIISATPDTLLAMERVVDALDQRRAQVLVEAIIVEMSDDTARELGVQFLLSGTGDSTTPFASTNFSRSAPNLLALAGAIIDPDLGGDGDGEGGSNQFTNAAVNSLLGTNGTLFGVGGQDGDTLFGAIINAVEQDTNSRVLSKPFNMTLDNGTSELLVGQDVPLTSGEVLGSDNTNPFRTVQREQVGVKLEVTPRISSDDTIRLDIYQEVSSVDDFIGGGASPDIILNTREFRTSLLADNGEIIVLGGLIEQTDAIVNSKVPFLGDIPVAGNLFKSEGRSNTRTNLMIFIKPTIVRDRGSANAVTARNYNYIRAQELLRGEQAGVSIDTFLDEVLGPVADPE
ncbi:MAG: type II secretion system protein GspD [Henriciella sp.]|jgi:general secretion pathway protein D|uniref:type II secretion system secretin GspD n=1 Tax=Henriciella sp. TaxID=1968823 RepID=UPI000C11BBA8|nr:type II secretion system secretin GspD [Henriciella sp.]MAN73928.1 type II secretion system protein GspD [Henriciella sp.]PHR79650.1 MAG: type II secretion system protein GspD [Henriciella sp.]|tara:strand:- start:4029 stop:5969 length:1941 start_codon:yes stop_codon:yes gene_type:complete